MKERWYGLDIYRIMAMVMITALHINFFNLGMMDRSRPFAVFCTGYLVEYACFAGVNCFAMLSGFMMGTADWSYDGKWLKKFILFWLKIITWAVVMYCGAFCFSKGEIGFSYDQFLWMLFPLDPGWWYVCSYLGLLLLLPLISRGIVSSSRRELLIFGSILFLVFSVIPLLCGSDGGLSLGNGYSTLWLLICFIYGALIRVFYDDLLRFKWLNKAAVTIVLICILLPCGLHLFLPDWRSFMSYTTPFCLLEAAGLLVLCAQIKLKRTPVIKAVTFVSLNSLGIYLFQNYYYIWQNFTFRSEPPRYSFVQLLWYFPAIVLLFCVIGIVCNFIVDKIFSLLPYERYLDKWCKR
jgi:surface polysaccharide O-acyltransferase-like enzyme